MTTLFRCFLTLFISTFKHRTFIQCCSTLFIPTPVNTQRCFNVDFTLSHVTTCYQPKDNVETTLKCLLSELSQSVNNKNIIHFPIASVSAYFLRLIIHAQSRSSRPEVFCKKGVSKNFTKRLQRKCFPVSFVKFLRTHFLRSIQDPVSPSQILDEVLYVTLHAV